MCNFYIRIIMKRLSYGKSFYLMESGEGILVMNYDQSCKWGQNQVYLHYAECSILLLVIIRLSGKVDFSHTFKMVWKWKIKTKEVNI